MPTPLAGDSLIRRFNCSVVFSLDLAHLLAGDSNGQSQKAIQELRSTEEMATKLSECLTNNIAAFGEWVVESERILTRMDDSERQGGKKVWTRRFLDRYSPLLLCNRIDRLMLSVREVLPAESMDTAGGVFRSSHFLGCEYRMAQEGVLIATFSAAFDAPQYETPEVIRSLADFRTDSFRTFRRFISDYFSNPDRLRLLREHTGLQFESQNHISDDFFRGVIHFHSFVLIEAFVSPLASDASLDIDQVVESVELAGILNEASWYREYASGYRRMVRDKQIGYRADEIYVTDRRTTVIVSDKYWRDDPLKFYRLDVLLVIEHHLARLAMLTQQLAFYRDEDDLRSLARRDPFDTLPLVLAGRTNFTLMLESLDFAVLVRHGFTRLFAERLRQEMGFTVALDVLDKRISDMSEALSLKSSVTSAQTSLRIAAQNNRLQIAAIVIATVALIVSIAVSVVTLETRPAGTGQSPKPTPARSS